MKPSETDTRRLPFYNDLLADFLLSYHKRNEPLASFFTDYALDSWSSLTDPHEGRKKLKTRFKQQFQTATRTSLPLLTFNEG